MDTTETQAHLARLLQDIQGYITLFSAADNTNALAYLTEALTGITVVVKSYYK